MTQTIIINQTEVRTIADLMRVLSEFPSNTKIHGAFEDPLIVVELFHKNFGVKTLSFE
jgi:hypothetical protein